MDFYAVLGLSRTASVAQIDRAYRRLVRQCHPGVNPGDRVAEDMYRRVQEAYAVLADSDRRRDYDLGRRSAPPTTIAAVAFEGFDFSAPAHGAGAATFSELFADVFQRAAREATTPARGADIELPLTVPFAEAMRGADVPLSLTRRERCSGCAGEGQTSRSVQACGACAGEGSLRWSRGHMVFTKVCDACGGAGQRSAEPCRTCHGAGVASRTEVLTLRLPVGIESGARVAVPGRGHAGARGGPSGDLYVVVQVAPHPHFRRVGNDLAVTIPVGIHEAALGARVSVPTLHGATECVIPPGATSGELVRIKGHGVPVHGGRPDEAGDLLAEIQIVLPAVLDDRSKDLLREFGRLNGADVRRSLFEAR